MSELLNVLFVEDSENDAKLLLMELRRGGWTLSHERVETADAMKAALASRSWQLIIADYSMPRFSGPAALELARKEADGVPFILISGKVGEETAVQAMRAGADDYLFKGDLNRLIPAVQRELRDAEERREARKIERELQKRDAQLIDAQRLAHLGTWHADLRSGEAVWSDEASKILGTDCCGLARGKALTFEEMIACLEPSEARQFKYLLGSTDVTTIAMDCQLKCAEADTRFVHIRGEIVRDEKGTAVEAAGMIQDITDRHLAEVQLQQARDAAEQANRAKSEFLANMSHEIRTPMTAILGFADMMLAPNQGPKEREECVRTVRRNAVHLLEIINDILDLSKIEAGRMMVERIPCNIANLLADLISLMRPRAVEKGLTFDVAFDGAIPSEITTDPTRLRQILVNLIGNAIKFTEAGGVKMVVSSAAQDSKQFLKVDIIDSGIGLTPEQIARLFKPFSQAEESTTRKFGGTGLGLTISQQFSGLLGGKITIASKPGVGSTFSLRVDAGDVSNSKMLSDVSELALTDSQASEKWEEIPLQGRILLAEDGKDNQRLLSTHLRASGAEVVIADNGQIAVEQAAKSSFDVILMDMQMPVMDGYTAARTLRERGFTTPIIALTAYAMAEDRQKCKASGCTDYLSKPIDRKLLLSTVGHYMSAKIPLSVDTEASSFQLAPAVGRGDKIKSSLLGYPGMKNIILEFIEGLPEELQKISDSLERFDMTTLRRTVHQIRGAAGGYGFDQITGPAAAAEESIRAEASIDVIREKIDGLTDIIRRIDGFHESEIQTARAA
jgi:signal transduction histidine kinase/CheY-like chemotaxis protein/HPt (histidine-containing phosphotransfer) domain-containing protein